MDVDRPVHGRAVGIASMPALGGLAAQGSQALASVVLQVLAARLLGLEGLGRFATLYAVIILATAICSGFVGDSLTVLDRADRRVRAGLQGWLAAIAIGAGVVCGLVPWAFSFLSPAASLAFGAAAALFLVEDTLRRHLMATLDFWRIVVVDLTALLTSLASIVTLTLSADRFTVTYLLASLAVGQLAATVAAVALVDPTDRWLAPMTDAAWSSVARFGGWRALQQAVRPTLLALMRLACLLAVSTAAVGALEAARIYMAPSMLAVGGISSYLFASYAANAHVPLGQLIHLADRSVAMLLAGIAIFGAAAVALLPWLGPLLTDGRYDLSVVAVTGWVCYAASVAAVTPYGQLGAVRGRQRVVLAWRLGDSAISLILVIAVLAAHRSVVWVPFALACGSISGGMAIRRFVLRPDVDR